MGHCTPKSEPTNRDTTRLQPVVLQLLNYKQPVCPCSGHHQALAGGTSTSLLNWGVRTLGAGVHDSAVRCRSDEIERPPAEAWWCPGRVGSLCSGEIERPPAEAWWCTSIIAVAPQLPTGQPFELSQRLTQHAFSTRPADRPVLLVYTPSAM